MKAYVDQPDPTTWKCDAIQLDQPEEKLFSAGPADTRQNSTADPRLESVAKVSVEVAMETDETDASITAGKNQLERVNDLPNIIDEKINVNKTTDKAIDEINAKKWVDVKKKPPNEDETNRMQAEKYNTNADVKS